MNRSAKILAVLLTLCMVLSLGAFASGEASGGASGGSFAQVDDTHWAGDSLTVERVEYAPEFTDQGYVDSTLFTSVSKIVTDAGEIDVDNAVYTPILTVDGVQVDLYNAENASFTGDVVLTLVEKGDSNANQGAPFGADKAQSSFGPFYYTAAAYISDGKFDAAKSVEEAWISGEAVDASADGLQVVSEGDYFSGLYITNSDYAVNDAHLLFTGAGGDDFNGWGAGIVVLGDSNVEINRSFISSQGVLRSGLFTSGSAVTTVKDSVIISLCDDDAVAYDTTDNYATPMMQQCPFGLGIEGNIRASLACGAGKNVFENSLVASNGWAVLSTDSGSSGADALISNATVAVVGTVVDAGDDAADFTVEVNGDEYGVAVGRYGETSGYIAYADSGVNDYAYGSAWYSPDYLGIITTGTVTMANDSYGWSGRIGFMSHSGGGTSGHGTLNISDSSFDIQDIFAVTQLKGTYSTSTTLNNVDIALAGNGADIAYLMINTDDNAGGPGNTSNTITDLTYDEYLACEAASGEPGANYCDLNIADSVIQGNIYNAATDDAIGLVVNLYSAEIDGAISSAWSYHVDTDGNPYDQTVFACDSFTGTRDGANGVYDYTLYLRVNADPAPTVNNPVTLNMLNGSKWMVTGDNYLSSLTIDETSSILGMNVRMTVDGVETEIAPGTYAGEIVLSAGEAPAREPGDAEIKAPVIGEAAQLAAAAENAAPAFEATDVFEPFDVEVGDGMTLPFSSVELAVTDTDAAIYIPDTAKLIECKIVDGEWIMEGSDFVDDAIIAAAKALYDDADGADGSAEAAAEDSGRWDAWIDYLKAFVEDGSIDDIRDQVLRELDEAQEEDYPGMLDGTVFGVFAFTYDAIPFEDFVG